MKDKTNAAPQASPSVAPADSEFGSAVGPAVAAPRKEKRVGTHWVGCWEAHHECAIAEIKRLQQAALPEKKV